MKESILKILNAIEAEIEKISTLNALNQLKAQYLGKSSELSKLLASLKDLDVDAKKEGGKLLNEAKGKISELIESQRLSIQNDIETAQLENGTIDVGLPGRSVPQSGSLHPLTLTRRKVINVFSKMGFGLTFGPEVESDYYNFEALNFPSDHPARDMQDTLFIDSSRVMRTHTSPVQVRLMEHQAPPIQVLAPGRVYRNDHDDTHSPVFHQIEGLCVASDVNFSDLKGTLEAFVREIFGNNIRTRFRPSFFPFTEPSAEMDVEWEDGWLEILGCGMVDPNVFNAVNEKWIARGDTPVYDPEKISGFAFGLGIERIAMLLYGIKDIRWFYENDLVFLKQFSWGQ